ncbi:MAG: PAS domain S-box protein [Syntrophobacteraceae bacterium]
MLAPAKRPFFMYLFAGTLVLTSVLSILVGWHVLDSYNDSRHIQSRDMRLLDLCWTVFHRDEVLSLAVWMAASSGEPKWEPQYLDFEPEIDAALREMATLEMAERERKALNGMENAHRDLATIEKRAFELLGSGERNAALELLSGKNYEQLQHTFLTNLNELMASVRDNMGSMVHHQGRQARYVLASTAVILPILLISWLFVLGTIRRYIAERNTAEASLRVSEQNYRQLVESANSIILRMDPEGKVTFFNDFAQSFFGYSPSEIYGRSVVGTIVPEKDSSGRDLHLLIKDVLRDADRFASSENENIRKDGERVWVSWTNRSIVNELGEVVGVLSIGNDITERKRTEEALREQYAFLQLLMDTIPSPIFHKDSKGIYQGCNKAFEAFLGLSKGEIVGKSVFDIAPPDLARKYQEMDDVLFAGPATQIYESSVKYADGTRHVVIFNKAGYLNSDGGVAGLVGVMVDITDRRQMEEVLRMDEARFEALFHLSQVQGRSTEEIIGFALERQVELTSSEIGFIGFMSDDEKLFDLHAWSAKVMDSCGMEEKIVHVPVEGGGLWAEAIRRRRPVIENNYSGFLQAKTGGYPLGHIPLTRLMSVPLIEGGRIVALVAVANKQGDYDASDARQSALFLDGVWKVVQLRKAERDLREAERLAAMGRALTSVAHDIKTPLVAIGGFTRLVQNHMNSASPDREKLDIVIRETQRLENMVKDMLDFSKPLQLHTVHEDINAIGP